MAIRWRKNGRLLCAAMSEPEEGDTYIGVRLTGMLNELRVIVADHNHKTNGLWYWTRDAIIVTHSNWLGSSTHAYYDLFDWLYGSDEHHGPHTPSHK